MERKILPLRPRQLAAGAIAAMALSVWAHVAPSAPEESAAAPTSEAASPLLPMPPTRLIPQPEGTPLPPRDLSIADHWPSDLKRLIDNMLTLFPKEGRPPSVKEVEKKMGITLTERPLKPDEAYLSSKRFAISGTRYMDTSLQVSEGSDLRESYMIDNGRYTNGEQRQTLRLVIAPERSGFCLNPYELAVYSGSPFVNGDTTRHAVVRTWPPAYVWGMFGWSNTGRYIGQGFRIVVGIGRNSETQKINQIGCVHTISVRGRYQGGAISNDDHRFKRFF